jgi:hypothetical protein
MSTVDNLLQTTARLSQRLNALEAEKRASPPFDRTARARPVSPEQAFQDREAAAGRLTEVIETDRTGRQISRFYGDPELVWGPFKMPSRLIASWRTK